MIFVLYIEKDQTGANRVVTVDDNLENALKIYNSYDSRYYDYGSICVYDKGFVVYSAIYLPLKNLTYEYVMNAIK